MNVISPKPSALALPRNVRPKTMRTTGMRSSRKRRAEDDIVRIQCRVYCSVEDRKFKIVKERRNEDDGRLYGRVCALWSGTVEEEEARGRRILACCRVIVGERQLGWNR